MEDLKQEGRNQIYSFRKKIALLELPWKRDCGRENTRSIMWLSYPHRPPPAHHHCPALAAVLQNIEHCLSFPLLKPPPPPLCPILRQLCGQQVLGKEQRL